MGQLRESREWRLEYSAAARLLADEATALAETVLSGSDDLIDCRFARIRVAYAKCKGAHAALVTEDPDENNPGTSNTDVARAAAFTADAR